MQKKRIIFLLLLFVTSFTGFIQSQSMVEYKAVTSDNNIPNQANMDSVRKWVLNILHGGGGVVDTNTVRFVGNPKQFCYFYNGDGILAPQDWNTGLGLSTGDLSNFSVPNNQSGCANNIGFGTPGDTSLWQMYKKIFKGMNPPPKVKMDLTGDATYIEFEYTPYDTVITIDYIFASDEYPFNGSTQCDLNITNPASWSSTNMNDFFGIFIESPYINDSLFSPLNMIDWQAPTGESINLPVCAGTVNSSSNNSHFYNDNKGNIGFEFDGFTKMHGQPGESLQIRKRVARCSKKKIKIAIEDFLIDTQGQKGFYINSTVFFRKGALKGGQNKPGWKITKKWEKPFFENKLIENCNDLLITFKLGFPVYSRYPILFSIDNNARNLIYVIDTLSKDTLNLTAGTEIDTLFFSVGDTMRTIRLVAHDLSFEQLKNCSFTYQKNPCDIPPPIPNLEKHFAGKIPLELVDNSPIQFSFEPNPGYKQYEAYCKETIDIRVDSSGSERTTKGGVMPLSFALPQNFPTEDPIFHYTVNNSPEMALIIVTDRCFNRDTAKVKIINKPIQLEEIPTLSFCAPGMSQEVTAHWMPVNDFPDYGFKPEGCAWFNNSNNPPTSLGNNANPFTIVYDNNYIEQVWQVKYNVTDVCGNEATGYFDVDQTGKLDIGDDKYICKGDSVKLITFTPSLNDDPNNYVWYKNSVSLGNEIGNGPSIIVTPPDTTQYILYILDKCNKVQYDSLIVFVDHFQPEITIEPSSAEFCLGDTVTLTANEANEWLWTPGGETTKRIIRIESQAGDYTYTLTASSDYCINKTTSTTFTVHANPSSAFSVDPPEHACTATDIKFDYDDNINNKTFLWNFDDGNTDTQPHTTHQYTNPGSYNVNLAIDLTYPQPTGHVCSSDSTFVLTVDPLPKPDFIADPVEGCEPLNVNFFDQSKDILPDATYQWDFGDGGSDNSTSPSHNYVSYGKYPVKLSISNTERCVAEINKPDFITVYPNPEANFVADPWIATMDHPVIDFLDSTQIVEGGINSYDWDFGDGDNSSDQNPEHTYGKAGDYEVTLLVESENSCHDTITKLVSITEFVKLYIPTAFSPGAAIPENRKFTIKGTPVDDFHLYIFNRYGQQVWSTHNFEIYWDGTDMNGLDVPAGTYIYRIEGTDYKKRNISYKGSVTLIR